MVPSMAVPSKAAPARSIFVSAAGLSWGSKRAASGRVIQPSTMLIRNTGRQVSPAMLALMMNPARIGPAIAEPPSTGPKTTKAVGCWARFRLVIKMPMP